MPSGCCEEAGSFSEASRKTVFAKASLSFREVSSDGVAGSTHSMRTDLPFNGAQSPWKDVVSSFETLKEPEGTAEPSAPCACANPGGISSCPRWIQPRDAPEI